MYPGADGMVVARLTRPFISMSAKNETSNGKACITNQYLPVSNSQITTEVTKIIKIFHGERSAMSPERNLLVKPFNASRHLTGTTVSIRRFAIRSVTAGNMAAARKTSRAPKKSALPQMASCWIFPRKPESWVRRASSPKLRKTKASMTTPSKIRSTMMVASEAETGTPSCFFNTTARRTSPARAG